MSTHINPIGTHGLTEKLEIFLFLFRWYQSVFENLNEG